MNGDALVWFQDSNDVGLFVGWEDFVITLLTRFGTTAYEDTMEALTRLKQTTSVVMYKGQFEALSNRIKGLSENHKLSCFLSRLKDDARLAVKMFSPKILNEAFGLAKIQEECMISSPRGYKPSFESAKPSILGPKLEVKLGSRFKSFHYKGYHLLKWRKGGKMVFASTVMTNSSLGINVSLLNSSC